MKQGQRHRTFHFFEMAKGTQGIQGTRDTRDRGHKGHREHKGHKRHRGHKGTQGNLVPRAKKLGGQTAPRPLSKGLDDRPPPPHLEVWIRHCNTWICTHWHTEDDLLLRLEEKTLTWCWWDVFEKTLQSTERTALNILMAAFAKNIAVNGSREERMHLVPSPHTDKNLITRKNYGERIERWTLHQKIYKNKKIIQALNKPSISMVYFAKLK